VEIPAKLKGLYQCSMRGASVFYFDPADRIFVSGTSAILLQFKIDASPPVLSAGDDKNNSEPIDRRKMFMSSDNLIRVKLKE
jgi:hypothetical protein